MIKVITASKLIFFKSEQYSYNNTYNFDTSNCPRPHFCMGYVTSGTGEYKDCSDGRIITVKPGDIIFVPIASCYISNWHGKPDISYTSIHFSFEEPAFFSKNRKFRLQKLTPASKEKTRDDFQFVLNNFNKDESEQLYCISRFYNLLGEIIPKLEYEKISPKDLRIADAEEYIEKNFTNSITVERLAKISKMSVSRFFPAFKSATGLTPVDYINTKRINRAIILLLGDENLSVEAISEAVGFESPAYFRRVFKKVTGKTPREYKNSGVEI